MMLALSVRFTCRDQAAAEAYDRLVAETITGIRDSEPGQYRVAEVTVDPDHAFGRPRFARGGVGLDDVIDLFRAGEPVDVVAAEFGLSRDEVEDALRVNTRTAA